LERGDEPPNFELDLRLPFGDLRLLLDFSDLRRDLDFGDLRLVFDLFFGAIYKYINYL